MLSKIKNMKTWVWPSLRLCRPQFRNIYTIVSRVQHVPASLSLCCTAIQEMGNLFKVEWQLLWSTLYIIDEPLLEIRLAHNVETCCQHAMLTWNWNKDTEKYFLEITHPKLNYTIFISNGTNNLHFMLTNPELVDPVTKFTLQFVKYCNLCLIAVHKQSHLVLFLFCYSKLKQMANKKNNHKSK
jgi:hypothetical protein